MPGGANKKSAVSNIADSEAFQLRLLKASGYRDINITRRVPCDDARTDLRRGRVPARAAGRRSPWTGEITFDFPHACGTLVEKTYLRPRVTRSSPHSFTRGSTCRALEKATSYVLLTKRSGRCTAARPTSASERNAGGIGSRLPSLIQATVCRGTMCPRSDKNGA
jgi:hypothetical protein